MLEDILKRIRLTGGAENVRIRPVIVTPNHPAASYLVNRNSGAPRIRGNRNIELISFSPKHLSSLSPWEFRCCVCGEIIKFPAYYLSRKLEVTSLEYFVCLGHQVRNRIKN